MNKKLLLYGSLLVLFYFAAFPLLLLVFKSASPDHIGNYALLFSNPSNWKALYNTLLLCVLTTLLTVIIGAPLAWLLYRTDLPKRNSLKLLFSIPYIIPPYIGAIAWIQLLNPTSGILNQFFMSVFGLTSAPFNIYGLLGTVFVLGLFFYSFILFALGSALEKMDTALEEASFICGASRFQTLRYITFPLMVPAILSGILLVFMAAAAAFGVPALLSTPARIYVLTTKIYSDVLSISDGIFRASSLSVVLMLIAIVGLVIHQKLLQKKQYTTLTGKDHRHTPWGLKKWRWPLFFLLILFSFIVIGLPLLTILISSFMKIAGIFSWENFSLRRYHYVLFDLSHTRRAFANSFLLSTAASTIALILGALIAYIKVKTTMRGKNWVEVITTLPYATPGTVVAIALILAFSGNYGLNLYNTLLILVAAYVVKYISFSVQNTSASLMQLDNSLEDAARISGASWFQSILTIIIPILRQSLIASWFLIFIPTFAELTMSVFLVGPQTETVGTLLFSLQSYDDPQSASVLASIIVFVIVGANLTVKKLTRGAYGV